MCAENVAELLKLRNVEMQGCHMWCARERSWIIIAIHSSAWGLNFGVHRLTLPLRAAVASGKRSQLLLSKSSLKSLAFMVDMQALKFS